MPVLTFSRKGQSEAVYLRRAVLRPGTPATRTPERRDHIRSVLASFLIKRYSAATSTELTNPGSMRSSKPSTPSGSSAIVTGTVCSGEKRPVATVGAGIRSALARVTRDPTLATRPGNVRPLMAAIRVLTRWPGLKRLSWRRLKFANTHGSPTTLRKTSPARNRRLTLLLSNATRPSTAA